MSTEKSHFSRRQLLGSSSAVGVASLLASSVSHAEEKVPQKFSGLKSLRPAPQSSNQKGAEPALPPFAARVLNKAGYGPRPGDVEAFNSLPGVDDDARLGSWLDEQLYPVDEQDTDLNARVDALKSPGLPYDMIDKSALELWQIARSDVSATRTRPVYQMERLILLRAARSKWQLREVLYDFWFNHFNIYGREFPAYGMMPEYDRQLRLHMFGKFEDMLLANAHTASMMYYLDNYANTWPNPNENYAREVMELHTLGAVENYYGAVDPETEVGLNAKGQRAGYTEIDVFELAKALTGWGVADGRSGDLLDDGTFLFRANQHYNFSQGDIKVMDVTISQPGNGEGDVTEILTYLARHYGTARYIAWKLCTRLVDDEPDPLLASDTADVFYDNRDNPEQLRVVYRYVLESTGFKNTWGHKVKRPVEAVVSAIRATDMDLTIQWDHTPSNRLAGNLDDTSHYPFFYAAPTGFPDERSQWQGSGPLVQTWRTITRLLREFEHQDENLNVFPILNLAEQTNAILTDPLQRTPAAIIDLWMTRALGYPLAAGIRQKIVDFAVAWFFVADENTAIAEETTANITRYSAYQKLMMALVGLILMSPDATRR